VRQLTGTDLDYRLAGIVYFGDMHFVACIIRQVGQIWFHNGITTCHNPSYKGSIGSGQLICLQHTPRMLIKEYIVVYISSCDIVSRYTYFYENYIAVIVLDE